MGLFYNPPQLVYNLLSGNSKNCEIQFGKTESNQFFAEDVNAYIQYDGNVGCSENVSTWITMKPSIEEVIAFETLDEITEFSYGN